MTTIRVELLNQTEGYGHQAISQSQSSIKSVSYNFCSDFIDFLKKLCQLAWHDIKVCFFNDDGLICKTLHLGIFCAPSPLTEAVLKTEFSMLFLTWLIWIFMSKYWNSTRIFVEVHYYDKKFYRGPIVDNQPHWKCIYRKYIISIISATTHNINSRFDSWNWL